MKIVVIENRKSLNNGLFIEEEQTLLVEMTQEEYQKCCAILYKEKKQK